MSDVIKNLKSKNIEMIADMMYLYGEDFSKILKDELKKEDNKGRNKIASGDLVKSIKPEVVVVGDLVELIILSEDYLLAVDAGRKPNHRPMVPVQALERWIKVKKGFYPRDKKGRFQSVRSTAFAIQRGIFNNGIDPTNVIEKSFDKSLKKLDVNNLVGEEALSSILDYFVNLDKKLRNS